MKFAVLILATIFSVSAFSATEYTCSVRHSLYETLKFSLDSSSLPTIELGEENATFSVTAAYIHQLGHTIPSEKCVVSTITDDDSLLMMHWRCTPAFSTEKYFSFLRFTFHKQEQMGNLHFGFTDIKSIGGPERHVQFSCL